MNIDVSIRRFAVLAALACCTGAQASDKTERTVAADARGEVEIVNIAGEVRVEGWDRNEVQVSGDLAGDTRLDVSSAGGRTSINVVSERAGRSRDASDMKVRVPRDSALSVNTVSADQYIENVRGTQRLQAVSGTITTEQWEQDVNARSISGDIAIRGHGGAAQATLNTVSGDVSLIDAPAQFAVETTTGAMRISVREVSRGRIRTTNGVLKLTGKLARDGRLEAEAVNGDLDFTLREPVNAQFDVETFNGDITNCFGPKPVSAHEFAPGNTLRFTAGAGDGRVRIKTMNGNVGICKE